MSLDCIRCATIQTHTHTHEQRTHLCNSQPATTTNDTCVFVSNFSMVYCFVGLCYIVVISWKSRVYQRPNSNCSLKKNWMNKCDYNSTSSTHWCNTRVDFVKNNNCDIPTAAAAAATDICAWINAERIWLSTQLNMANDFLFDDEFIVIRFVTIYE